MDILRFLFYAFLFYMAYKLVFDFIIPVYRTTKRVKKGFREMQERMNQHAEQYQQQQGRTHQTVSNENQETKSGDYIEFEEIK
jgi:Sec-independent protein translocase protein TatA